MRIVRTVHVCRVDNITPGERAWLNEFLSVPTVEFYGGRPSPTVRRYYDDARRTFPPGLLKLVQRESAAEGFVVDVVDERERPPGGFIIPSKFRTKQPHDYQIAAAKKAYAAECSLIEIGTAGGKSFISAIIMASVQFRCIYVVSSEQLAEQAAAEFELEVGERAGRVFSGRIDFGARCVFATFGTLYSKMKADAGFARRFLHDFGWLIVDEAHEVPAKTFNKVALAISAFFRTGLSATPLARSDGKAMGVIAATGPLSYRKTLKELADMGHAAMATIRMVRYPQDVFIGLWTKAYTYQVVKDAGRNALVASIAMHAKKPCLVLFNDVEHGAILLRALQARGIKAERADGRATVSARKELARRLDAGDVDVLVASRIFRTGVNVRKLRTVIHASGRKSEKEVVQGMGRGARLALEDSKTLFDIWDILDVSVDGKGGKGRWIADHAKARLRVYRKQGNDVLVADSVRGPWETVPALDPRRKDDDDET